MYFHVPVFEDSEDMYEGKKEKQKNPHEKR